MMISWTWLGRVPTRQRRGEVRLPGVGAVGVDGADGGEQADDAGDDVPVVAGEGVVDVGAHAGVVPVVHAAHAHVHGGRWRR